MKRRLTQWLSGLFIFLTLSLVIVHNAATPRILVLHSYGPDYSWTRDVDVGLRRVLPREGSVLLRWHYMDLKRHPWPEAKVSAGVHAREVIDSWRPDIILAVDDDAQEYAAKYYVDNPKRTIIFAGTNGSVTPYGYDEATNVTGIFERLPLQALKDTLLHAGFKKAKNTPLRLLEISDDSPTVHRDEEFIRAYNWEPVRFLGSRLVDTFDDWKKVVLEAQNKADVLLTTNYRALARSRQDSSLVPPKEVVAWTMSNSTLPMVGCNGFFVEDGGMLAIATSPFEQGEVAATMAMKLIVKKVAPRTIPVASTKQFLVYMRPKQLTSHRLSLPPLYEAFARATHNYFIEP